MPGQRGGSDLERKLSWKQHPTTMRQPSLRPRELESVDDNNDRYGRFVLRPLESGFGTTLGNSLRRILLSSIQGASITSLRINGVLHEFSYLPGVVEDVTSVVLNMKGVLLQVYTNEAIHGNSPRRAGTRRPSMSPPVILSSTRIVRCSTQTRSSRR